MERKYDLSDSYERMKYRELMLPNWCQKKYKPFVKQLEEYAPYGEGLTDLLLGLCYQHGWGVWKNKDTARQYFSRLGVGKTVWFGHYVSFMECEIIRIEADRILLMEKRPRIMNLGYGRQLLFPPKEAAPWDSCLARKWMNTEYYEDTFYKQERDLIQKVRISTGENPITGTKYAGKECEDKVFPLSLQEYMDHKGLSGVPSVDIRYRFSERGPEYVRVRREDYVIRITTREAQYIARYYGSKANPLNKETAKQTIGSVLRTPGSNADTKVFVIDDLVFYEGEKGHEVKFSDIKLGYQPAFWVSLK